MIYEIEGCQKAIDFLARHYGVRRMRITVDGRRAGRRNRACYFENRAYFSRRGLNKSNILHEFYHHLSMLKAGGCLVEQKRKMLTVMRESF